MDCHPCSLVGIAKHLDTRTDRQPILVYELSDRVLVYSYVILGDFTRNKALSRLFQIIISSEILQSYEKLRILAYVCCFM